MGLKSASGIPQLKFVGTLTQDQLREIAEIKLPDLNANDNRCCYAYRCRYRSFHGRACRGVEMKKTYVPSKKLAAILRGEA